MKLISHRGNLNGPNEIRENSPHYIIEAIAKGYDVEIDLWWIDGKVYLGHDEPQYEVSNEWLGERIDKLWIHCKNIDAIIFFKESQYKFNYFWHEEDTVTLTSQNYIWAYPGNQPIKNSIAVMPEINKEETNICLGICSDYIENYNK
jgi:hypothetical protein